MSLLQHIEDEILELDVLELGLLEVIVLERYIKLMNKWIDKK